jgi:hypothetical protein
MSIDLKIAASGLLSLHSHVQNPPLEPDNIEYDGSFLESNHWQQNTEKRAQASFLKTKVTNSSSNDQQAYDLHNMKDGQGERKTVIVDTHHFLAVLMSLLTDVIHKDKLSFLPDGKLFMINRVSFTRSVMRKYFNISTFALFIRALKQIGFSQIKHHTISVCVIFYHPSFCRIEQEVVRNCLSECFRKSLRRRGPIKADVVLRHEQSSRILHNASNGFNFSTQERKMLDLCDNIGDLSLRLRTCIRMSRFSRHRCRSIFAKDLVGACDTKRQMNLCHSTNGKTALSLFERYRTIEDVTNDVIAAGVQCLLHS